jgi:phasin family protein
METHPMAKKPEPSFNFDFGKMMPDFDVTKMMGEFSKAFGEFKVPGVDVDKMMESQRKNLEALTNANRAALEGFQAVVKRQSEILGQTLDEASTALQELSKSGTPQDTAALQAAFLKDAMEKALANMRELAELVAKSNAQAFEAINKRLTDSLDEIRDLALKLKK